MLRLLAVAALATLASGDSSPGTAPPGSCICSNAGNNVNIYGTCAKVETTDNGMKGKKKVITHTATCSYDTVNTGQKCPSDMLQCPGDSRLAAMGLVAASAPELPSALSGTASGPVSKTPKVCIKTKQYLHNSKKKTECCDKRKTFKCLRQIANKPNINGKSFCERSKKMKKKCKYSCGLCFG